MKLREENESEVMWENYKMEHDLCSRRRVSRAATDDDGWIGIPTKRE